MSEIPVAAVGPQAVANSLLKTEHCRYFARGECTKGEACTYIHDASQKRKAEENEENGAKRARSAPLTESERAQRYKTKECKFFPQGKCSKGERCPYIHAMPFNPGMPMMPMAPMGGAPMGGAPWGMPRYGEPMMPLASAMPGGPVNIDMTRFKTKTCKFFDEGKCSRGEMCTFLHSGENAQPVRPRVPFGQAPYKYKTQTCKFFAEGKCQRGDGCTFSHGNEPAPAAGVAAPRAVAAPVQMMPPTGWEAPVDPNYAPMAAFNAPPMYDQQQQVAYGAPYGAY